MSDLYLDEFPHTDAVTAHALRKRIDNGGDPGTIKRRLRQWATAQVEAPTGASDALEGEVAELKAENEELVTALAVARAAAGDGESATSAG